MDSRFQELSEYNQDLQRFEPKTYEDLHDIKHQTISTTCTTTRREFSYQVLENTINELFVKDPERTLKLYTGAGGLKSFHKVFQNKFG